MSAPSLKEKLGQNYSSIISPEFYNLLMSEQHLYIKAADQYIAKTAQQLLEEVLSPEVVEIGCGPARITSLVHSKLKENCKLYALDLDQTFLSYAQTVCKNLPIHFIHSSIEDYSHPKSVDLFYSEGFHHHVPKGKALKTYLTKVFDQLTPGGYYIVGDEFIAEYGDNSEREINLVLWYSHIIANADNSGFSYLAQEEAKTLLDDIYEGRSEENIKNSAQIKFVLEVAPLIERKLKSKKIQDSIKIAKKFANKLKDMYNSSKSEDETIDLSRGDFKISCSKFCEEVTKIGFTVESFKSFGPSSGIGCMGVYVLRKP